MKFLVFLCAISTTTVAIRVPSSWDTDDNQNPKSDAEEFTHHSAEYRDANKDENNEKFTNANLEDEDHSHKTKSEYIYDDWVPVKSTEYSSKPNYHKVQPKYFKGIEYQQIILSKPYGNPAKFERKYPPLPSRIRTHNKPSITTLRRKNVLHRIPTPYITHRKYREIPKKRIYKKETGPTIAKIIYDPFRTATRPYNGYPKNSRTVSADPFYQSHIPQFLIPPHNGVQPKNLQVGHISFDPFRQPSTATPNSFFNVNQPQQSQPLQGNTFFSNFDQISDIHRADAGNNLLSNVNNAQRFQLSIPSNHNPSQSFQSHLRKNYRDDKTHEPTTHDSERDTENTPEIQREEDERGPISIHEQPREIPTKPIYPGQGQWAKPGIVHRPYISDQKYTALEESEELPAGYDTFIEGKELFDQKKGQLTKTFDELPEKHRLGKFLLPKEEVVDEQEQQGATNEQEGVDEDEEDEFVPMKLYAQVRHSENEEHLPSDAAEDGRLKEVIRDSKIQTVYTEEGYEDIAYDHAGHEKKAQNQEGFAEYEKEVDKDDEKKAPIKIPRLEIETKKYFNKSGLNEDAEEIDNSEDSDSAGSHYSNTIELPKKYAPGLKYHNNKNNFISTKETKTLKTMQKDDGNVEMEISGKLNVIVQPNNSTKPHKFSKVYPKVYKIMNNQKKEEDDFIEAKVEQIQAIPTTPFSNRIFIEEIITTEQTTTLDTTSTEIPSTRPITDKFEDMFDIEIPITTLATTAIPRNDHVDNRDDINKAFLQINSKTRVKRFTNDFPKLDIDTDFIGKINHQLGTPGPSYSKSKYPYYQNFKKFGINNNSPLRYAENMKNIPLKAGGDLAFYNQADATTKCADIPSTVDPVPDRVKDAENNAEQDEYNEEYDEAEDDDEETAASEDLPELAEAPRLQGLGDKIDCLKAKYFGVNPLDSPFFQEDKIGPVDPIFNFNSEKLKSPDLQIVDNGQEITTLSAEHKSVEDIAVARRVPNIIQHDEEVPSASNNEIDVRKESEKYNKQNYKTLRINKDLESTTQATATFNTLKPMEDATIIPVSLLTTPKYTINLKPKHIYHQIQLLSYLPEYEHSETDDIKTELSSNHTDQNTENRTDESTMHNEISDNSTESITVESQDRSNNTRQSKSIPAPSDENDSESIPEAEALRRHRIRMKLPPLVTASPPFKREKTKMRMRKPPFQIFDINKFLPSTPPPIIHHDLLGQSTVLPKYKVVSEVFYKDDIKPNEQLNVLNDVINIIRNSSEEHISDSAKDSSEDDAVTIKNKDSYLKAYGDQEVDNTYYATIATEKPHIIRKYNQFTQNTNPNLKQKKMKTHKYRTTTISLPDVTTQSLLSQEKYVEDTTNFRGITPIVLPAYKIILNSKRDNTQQTSNYAIPHLRYVNRYLVIGMRPPPKQKVFLYSDFNQNKYQNRRQHRAKRNANRASYAALSRSRGRHPEQTKEVEVENVKDDDDDDYVPHRPRNYHYDEKTGKIVYHNKQTPKEDDEEEEIVEYEEIIEEPAATTSKPKQNPIFATATPPPQGQSYIDFVKKLKSAAGYVEIPDPTTTEKPLTTTVKITTSKPASTNPPEFLSILSKVRSNTDYKFIEDKKKTTTAAPEELEEDDVITTTTTTTIRTTTATEEPTTHISRQRTRGRRPVNNTRHTHTTTTESTSTTTEAEVPHHDKARRNYRRRPTRIHRTTTEKFLSEDLDDTTKIVRRRSGSPSAQNRFIKDTKLNQAIEKRDNREEKPKSNVEVFKAYDPSQKHGGNYKSENKTEKYLKDSNGEIDYDTNSDKYGKEHTFENQKVLSKDHVEIIKEYDENQKHGGNYRKEDSIAEKRIQQTDKPLIINLLAEDTVAGPERVQDQITQNTYESGSRDRNENVTEKPKRRKRPQKKYTNNPVTRLTDIVPKPESYYSDPNLPLAVNMLVEKSSTPLDLSELIPDTKDDNLSVELSTESIGNQKQIEQQISNLDAISRQPVVVGKLPKIILDPSKRLYYYAPL